jgi:transposase
MVVGVDIGKFVHVAVGDFPDRAVTKPIKIPNERAGFEHLLVRAHCWQEQAGCRRVVIGLESTGHYWEPLAGWLIQHGVQVVHVNPLHTRRAKELEDNSPGKTDAKDSRVIADLVRQGHFLTCVLPQGVLADLRLMVSAYDRLVREQTAKSNCLQSLVDLIFPEWITVFKKITGKTSLCLLQQVPTPEEVLAQGPKRLRRFLKRQRCGYRACRIPALAAVAQSSVGLREGLAGYRLHLHQLVTDLQEIASRLNVTTVQIQQTLGKIPEAAFLLSVKGMGPLIAATLLGETGGFGRYQRAAEVLKLAGLNLYEQSSGRHQGQRRISKRGRPLLRQALYLAATRQAKPGFPLHEAYQGLVDRGVPKVKALIAIACKLTRLLFALVRDGRCYSAQPPVGMPVTGMV